MRSTSLTRPARLQQAENVAHGIFFTLFFQVQALVVLSIWAQSGIAWAKRYFFGLDFYDFYTAYSIWKLGGNPYQSTRLVTPPPSILVGGLLHSYGFDFSRYVFSAVNVALILTAILLIGNKFSFSNKTKIYLAGITFLYYPFLFLIDRGNLDGLVLICITMLIISESNWKKIAWISLAGSLKLYGLLALAVFIRKRQWSLAIGTILVFALLLLPFHSLMLHFFHNLTARGTVLTGTENISPAAILGYFGRTLQGKIVYVLFWIVTLFIVLIYAGQRSPIDLIFMCLPWMAALPLQVYPYTGLLLLLTSMWKLSEVQDRGWNKGDGFFFLGFIFAGVQAEACTQYAYRILRFHLHPRILFPVGTQVLFIAHHIFYMLNSIGTTIILLSITASAFRQGSQGLQSVPPAPTS